MSIQASIEVQGMTCNLHDEGGILTANFHIRNNTEIKATNHRGEYSGDFTALKFNSSEVKLTVFIKNAGQKDLLLKALASSQIEDNNNGLTDAEKQLLGKLIEKKENHEFQKETSARQQAIPQGKT